MGLDSFGVLEERLQEKFFELFVKRLQQLRIYLVS